MAISPVYEMDGLEDPFALPGLTEEVLAESLVRGETLKAEATALDAPTRGGLNAHFEKVLALREELVPHGWTYSNSRNYCTVVSPCGRHAIAVARGTEGTGVVHPQPETVRGMGPATSSVVDINRVQLDLFAAAVQDSSPARLTWILLNRRVGDTIYSELSLPEAYTDEGVVCKWRQRLRLEPIELGGQATARKRYGETETAEAIEVPVALRG